jgi:hypothetical protein
VRSPHIRLGLAGIELGVIRCPTMLEAIRPNQDSRSGLSLYLSTLKTLHQVFDGQCGG